MRKSLAALVLVSILMMPVFVSAQQPASPTIPQAATPTEGKQDAAMMEKCKMEHEKRMAEMKAMDARIDDKLAAMNAAKGDQKVEAMASVINELVSQRREMRGKVGTMHHHDGMKHPMMGKESAMPLDCPMMKHQGGMQVDTPPKKESSQ
jgi:hypothetical protein